MSTPQQQIETAVKAALKAGEKEKLSTMRMLLNAINNERIRRGREVDEAAFLGLVRKAIKQRQEASEQFRKAGRQERADREDREAEFLSAYLPPPADEAQIKSAIREFVAAEGLSGPQSTGPVMREMMARFSGSTGGGTINRLVREVLAEES